MLLRVMAKLRLDKDTCVESSALVGSTAFIELSLKIKPFAADLGIIDSGRLLLMMICVISD